MVLIAHILIALSSIVCATYALFSPSFTKLKATYGLVGLTLASGFYLVYLSPSHMVQACTSGLVYIAVVSAIVVLARRKLVAISVHK